MARVLNPHISTELQAQAEANVNIGFLATQYAWDYCNISIVFSDEAAKLSAEMLHEVTCLDLSCSNDDAAKWLSEMTAFAADLEHTPEQIATFGRDRAKEIVEESFA